MFQVVMIISDRHPAEGAEYFLALSKQGSFLGLESEL